MSSYLFSSTSVEWRGVVRLNGKSFCGDVRWIERGRGIVRIGFWRLAMERGARWMTIVVVGICSFALLARMANFAHFAVGRRVTKTEGAGKSMGTGGAMETAWADQAVAAAGAGGTQSGGGAQSGVGIGDKAMRDALVAQERAGLEALKVGDVAGFAAMLGEEAVFVDDHGPATKAEVVRNVAGFRIIDYGMEDVRLVRVSDAAGMIVYRLTEHGASHGKEFSAVVYVSTLYVMRGGKWVSLFSQETGARKVS